MNTQSRHKGPLLIVDDREEVRWALHRYFGLCFEQVYVAGSPGEAEEILEHHQPILLLCDYWLGNQYPPATDLIPAWRKRYPCLQRIALMTGTKASALGDTSCADRVFQKPLDMKIVTGFLQGEPRVVHQ